MDEFDRRHMQFIGQLDQAEKTFPLHARVAYTYLQSLIDEGFTREEAAAMTRDFHHEYWRALYGTEKKPT